MNLFNQHPKELQQKSSLFGLSHTDSLLVYALVYIIFLIVIKAKVKWHPFIALLLASVILGILAGMDIPDVADAVQTGVGNTLD